VNRALLITLGLAAAASCGKDKKSGGGGASAGAGCIQGVVVDGLSAGRIAVPREAEQGVFVLVQGSMLQATPLVAADAAEGPDKALLGEYYLCGLPLDEDFPLFVWMNGYQDFEGEVVVHSTAAARSPQATADILKQTPTEIANIRVYPKNQQTKDLSVLVTHNGAPLPGASVVLRATGGNFLDPSGMPFVPPRNIRSPALTGTTDAAGTWSVPAADLVLGGHYTYTIIPPNGGAEHTAVADTFVLGLRDQASTDEPYRITVDLDRSIGALAILSRSTDREDPEPTGKVTIFLNREFEIVPGTEDSIRATLGGAVTAALADDNATNKAPDQVKVTIDRNTLTLEPVFKTKPDADTTKEPLLQIDYSGLVLRPKQSPDTLATVTVSSTVRFYR
jgi:hypothetical protein